MIFEKTHQQIAGYLLEPNTIPDDMSSVAESKNTWKSNALKVMMKLISKPESAALVVPQTDYTITVLDLDNLPTLIQLKRKIVLNCYKSWSEFVEDVESFYQQWLQYTGVFSSLGKSIYTSRNSYRDLVKTNTPSGRLSNVSKAIAKPDNKY